MVLEGAAEYENIHAMDPESAERDNGQRVMSPRAMSRGEKIAAGLAATVVIAGLTTGVPTVAPRSAPVTSSAHAQTV
jgi:hypothetical protein